MQPIVPQYLWENARYMPGSAQTTRCLTSRYMWNYNIPPSSGLVVKLCLTKECSPAVVRCHVHVVNCCENLRMKLVALFSNHIYIVQSPGLRLTTYGQDWQLCY